MFFLISDQYLIVVKEDSILIFNALWRRSRRYGAAGSLLYPK